jgi:NTF2-like protein (DUF6841)
VDNSDVTWWFGEYLDVFAECCRGERDTGALLGYFGVPLLLTTDGGYFALASEEQVVAGLQPQIGQMRAAGYARSEILGAEITVLNATSALYQGKISRQRGDGSEISLLVATYLVTDGPAGRRFSALAVQC